MRNIGSSLLLLLFGVGVVSAARAQPDGAIIWRLDDPRRVGGTSPLVLGEPRAVVEDGRKAVRFDGIDDGLILDRVPIQGWRAFTIEVLFKPDGDGPTEQRFVHLQDAGENRALIETRVTPERKWYLDTFLYSRPADKGVTLVDRQKLHPCDQWYWAALVYDGSLMSHYVNGTKEREDTIAYGPMREGQTSLGVRLNRVFWFKGCIAEVRFHPRALRPADLQRAAPPGR